MHQSPITAASNNLERLSGVVERVTYHSPDTGWTVVKVSPFDSPGKRVAVVVHQVQVFAGSTMDFFGSWTNHPKYGEQFRASRAVERKPASLAALEKYLGSGLIRGVGPITAKKIVRHFGDQTLEIFDQKIDDLKQIRGIAEAKLQTIREAWREHQSVRDVMLFLQEYGVSTLFAVKIYKEYGDEAIAIVKENPYRLARDIYGVGFFSADRIALAVGFAEDSDARIEAGVKHVLAASRDEGHCFLTIDQVCSATDALLQPEGSASLAPRIKQALARLLDAREVKLRTLPPTACQLSLAPTGTRTERQPSNDKPHDNTPLCCYYANSLYRDEFTVAKLVSRRAKQSLSVDRERVLNWVQRYCATSGLELSTEQRHAVCGVVEHAFSVLTGGPGCGKTTATRALVRLLVAMGKQLLLAAPTGRAAQRMTEVIGMEARTIHRLLEWEPKKGGFKRGTDNPLPCDFLVVDETSMLDISLCASLLGAVPAFAQVLFIGDPNQLPSVGAGNVLRDLLATNAVQRFALTKVFRQAEASHIIRYAHAINAGETPKLCSPIADPRVWERNIDCLFLDAEEATQEQLRFIRKAKALTEKTLADRQDHVLTTAEGAVLGRATRGEDGQLHVAHAHKETAENGEAEAASEASTFIVPRKFLHVDLESLARTDAGAEELAAVLGRIPRYSALHFNMSATDVVRRLYTKTLKEHLGEETEIQILTPMNRGSLGAVGLNQLIQRSTNPEAPGRAQIELGERVFRVGDRVIQRRNNYDKGVFNGDIGHIVDADPQSIACTVAFCTPGQEQHTVSYQRDDMVELALAYAITIHKSQGSEFDAVIVPLCPQHHKMLFRNLVYTGLTRAKKMAIFVGSRYALRRAVENADSRNRQTALSFLIEQDT